MIGPPSTHLEDAGASAEGIASRAEPSSLCAAQTTDSSPSPCSRAAAPITSVPVINIFYYQLCS